MNRCLYSSCPYMGSSGYCQLTACIMSAHSQIAEFNKPVVDAIFFPQIIGCITFYNSKELIKWVKDQQKINIDQNYGIGNWA